MEGIFKQNEAPQLLQSYPGPLSDAEETAHRAEGLLYQHEGSSLDPSNHIRSGTATATQDYSTSAGGEGKGHDWRITVFLASQPSWKKKKGIPSSVRLLLKGKKGCGASFSGLCTQA